MAAPSTLKRPTIDRDHGSEAHARAYVSRLIKLEAAEPRGFDWEDDCRERASLSYGVSGAVSGGLVEVVDFEARRYSCRTEDESTFNADGWVR